MTVFFLGGYLSPDLLALVSPNVSSSIIDTNYSTELHNLNILTDRSIDNIDQLYTSNELSSLTAFAHIDFLNDSYNKAIYTWILFLDKFEDSFTFGFKVIFVVFLFIWVRASFPRLRYDQLMALCWKALLPLVFAYIIFTLTLLFVFDMFPVTNSLPG